MIQALLVLASLAAAQGPALSQLQEQAASLPLAAAPAPAAKGRAVRADKKASPPAPQSAPDVFVCPGAGFTAEKFRAIFFELPKGGPELVVGTWRPVWRSEVNYFRAIGGSAAEETPLEPVCAPSGLADGRLVIEGKTTSFIGEPPSTEYSAVVKEASGDRLYAHEAPNYEGTGHKFMHSFGPDAYGPWERIECRRLTETRLLCASVKNDAIPGVAADNGVMTFRVYLRDR
jgi:hypothetical protein